MTVMSVNGAPDTTRFRIGLAPALALVVTVVLGSCSSNDADLGDSSTAQNLADSRPVAAEIPGSLEACGHEVEQPSTVSIVGAPSISVRPAETLAGSEFMVVWSGLGDFSDLLVGGRLTISCWTGRAWETAWFVGDAFRNDPFIYYPEDDVSPIDLGFLPANVQVPVAEEAPAGQYRLIVDVPVCEPDCQGDFAVAYFAVVGGGL